MPKRGGKILNPFQRKFLELLSESPLAKKVVWSGGTALAFFYLKHRYSYDLDFMSKELLPGEYLLAEMRKISRKLGVKKMQVRQHLNRNEFFLKKNTKNTLRVEFVYYPFPSLKKPKLDAEFKLKIDSPEDILTNKTHALYERAEPKDVLDFYLLRRKLLMPLGKVLQLVEQKFGVEIDPALFAARALAVAARLKEIRPLLLKKINFAEVEKGLRKSAGGYLQQKIKS